MNTVKIEEGVQEIGDYVFDFNFGLIEIYIPSTVTNFGAIGACPNVSKLTFLVKPAANIRVLYFTQNQTAPNCDLLLNKEWKGNAKLDMQNNTFNGTKFKSITLVNLDGTPAQ